MSTQVSAKSRAIQSVNTKYLTMSGLMAAMITIMTAYIGHIPTGVNGGYIHFGDSLIYIAATILPTPYALAAAAIGGGLADLLTAPMWAPATVIIKMLITIPFTNKSVRIINGRNVLVAVLAYFISGISYFVAEYIIFGNASSAFLVSMSGSLVQSGGSAIFFVVFGLALDRMRVKDRIKDMQI